MSYKAHSFELSTALAHQTYEDFCRVWKTYYESEFNVLVQDNVFISYVYSRTLMYPKLRILAFLLRHPTLTLKYKIWCSGDLQYVAARHYFPIFLVEECHNYPSLFHCAIPTLCLILYLRGMEPFQTIVDEWGRSAEWHYTHGKAKTTILANGQTIKQFMEATWQDIQAHRVLLVEARELMKQKCYTEAYQTYNTAAEQLTHYAGGDADLAIFYREEQGEIYKEVIAQLEGNRVEIVSFIARYVLPNFKHVPKTDPQLCFFEEILRCPMPTPLPLPTRLMPSSAPSDGSASSASSQEGSPSMPRPIQVGLHHRKGFQPLDG